MAWFPEPNITDTESYYTFFRFVNNAVEGLFFPVIILVIWIVSFTAMLFSGSYDRPSGAKAWIFACFFCSILAVPLVVLDLMARKYMYILFVLLGIGVIWIILEGRSSD